MTSISFYWHETLQAVPVKEMDVEDDDGGDAEEKE